MINTQSERIAVHEAAAWFTKAGWLFHEQHIDFGIDAIADWTEGRLPTGRRLAIQIKGGDSSLNRGREGIIHYFPHRHQEYWMSLARSSPVILIIFDIASRTMYWEQIDSKTIHRTEKQCSILVPYSNEFTSKTKERLLQITDDFFGKKMLPQSQIESSSEEDQFEITIVLGFGVNYLIRRGAGLICQVSFDGQTHEVALNYRPRRQKRKPGFGVLNWDDPYYFVIEDLKRWIIEACETAFNNGSAPGKIIRATCNKIKKLISGKGIEGIAAFLFNRQGKQIGIPSYTQFLRAFEKYSSLRRTQYEPQIVGTKVVFQTAEGEYESGTYEGLTFDLTQMIQERSYEDLEISTHQHIWSEIYLDAGIEKSDFIPEMLNQWEFYWESIYTKLGTELSSKSLLDEQKQQSWRQLTLFAEGYNDAGDVIQFAANFGIGELYPLAVISMLRIFDSDVCYNEYCELEFFGGEWEDVELNKNVPIIFFKKADF